MRKLINALMAGLIVGGLLLVSVQAFAGTCAPRIDCRQAYQQGRIYQGINSGQVSPWEFYRLERQQARIRGAEALMKADGRLTPRNRARLHAMQDRSSANIYRAKHNNRRVY